MTPLTKSKYDGINMSNNPTTLETAETGHQNYGGELIRDYLRIVNGEGFHRKMADVLKNSPHDLLNKEGPLLKGNNETWRVTMGNNERKEFDDKCFH